MVLSENRAQSLVRPVYRVDERGGARDAPAFQTPLPGGTPRRKTARPGPSPAGEWMICGSGGLARTSTTSLGTASGPISDHARPSTSRPTPRTRLPERHLAGVPPLDQRPQPEGRPARPEIEDGPWHVWIPALVLTHGVAVAQPEDPGNVVSVDEIVDQNSSWHIASLRLSADVSYACNLSVRRGM